MGRIRGSILHQNFPVARFFPNLFGGERTTARLDLIGHRDVGARVHPGTGHPAREAANGAGRSGLVR